MEGRIKRYKINTTVSVSWLNLHLHIPQRDIRKLIYKLLNSVDWQIVQYAHTGKGIETDSFIEECAVRGHFELVKWGVAQSYQMIDVRTCHCAVQGGNLKIIQWLQTNGHTIECSLSLCEIAAGYGQLEVLKWCRRNGYYWDHWVCLIAAVNGHLSVLQWAVANGCTMSYPNIRSVTRHQHIIDWLDSVRSL